MLPVCDLKLHLDYLVECRRAADTRQRLLDEARQARGLSPKQRASSAWPRRLLRIPTFLRWPRATSTSLASSATRG